MSPYVDRKAIEAAVQEEKRTREILKSLLVYQDQQGQQLVGLNDYEELREDFNRTSNAYSDLWQAASAVIKAADRCYAANFRTWDRASNSSRELARALIALEGFVKEGGSEGGEDG